MKNTPSSGLEQQQPVRIVRALLKAGVFTFAGMALYESLKQAIFPHLTLWQSHSITIVFSTIVAMAGALLILHGREKLYSKLQREAEEKFSRAFNASPEPTSIKTLVNGRYIDANSSFLRVSGYGREEVIGQTTEDLKLLIPSDYARFITMFENEHFVRDMELTFRTKAGEMRTGLISAEPIDIQGQRCVLTVTKDITEQKCLEKQLYQAQKMEAIGRLTGGIAHDFNNLLGVIIGYSEMLGEQISHDSPLHGKVEQIEKAGNRAAALTRQLLAFSRQQVLNLEVLNLNEVIADIEKMLRPMIGEDIELTTVLNRSNGCVKADQSQIEQVIINLAVNSRDAMPHGGKLFIETARVEVDEEFVARHPGSQLGQYILLTVADTGEGMDAETQARIFEPFFTTKEVGKGTGLGLATVYGIVKQSGGYIVVDSEPKGGTIFKIYLPVANTTLKAMEDVQTSASGPNDATTILLVEDETGLRELLRDQLDNDAFNVLEAESPAQAIAIARSYSSPIHLLLSDVVMPEMNGPALAKILLGSRPDMKVLYMSGYTSNSTLSELLDSGKDILQKPFTRRVLLHKVQNVLECEPAIS